MNYRHIQQRSTIRVLIASTTSKLVISHPHSDCLRGTRILEIGSLPTPIRTRPLAVSTHLMYERHSQQFTAHQEVLVPHRLHVIFTWTTLPLSLPPPQFFPLQTRKNRVLRKKGDDHSIGISRMYTSPSIVLHVFLVFRGLRRVNAKHVASQPRPILSQHNQ